MKKLYHICLTHLAREYYEKLRFKTKTKIPTLNSYISKARANSESKLKFSECSFSFLQNNIVFCTLYPHGYMAGGSALYNPWCCCQQLAVLKEVMMSEEKFWICCFLSIPFGNAQKLLKNCNFSLLDWAKEMFLLNPFSEGILWKSDIKKTTTTTTTTTLNGYI